MAVQTRRRFMKSHARIAMSAFTAPATVMTYQRISKSTAVKKKQYLVTAAQSALRFIE
jgi:hypothetical protein